MFWEGSCYKMNALVFMLPVHWELHSGEREVSSPSGKRMRVAGMVSLGQSLLPSKLWKTSGKINGSSQHHGGSLQVGCLDGLSSKWWESIITSGLGDFWWTNLVSSGQRVGGSPWWGGDAGEGDWFTFLGVNYLVDADELGRDVKIYKDFVMGLYLHTYSVIDQNGITRHPDSIDSFRYVNGVCTRNRVWYAGGIFPFIFIFLSP